MVEDVQKLGCWPLGSLLENPFVSNRNSTALEEMQSVKDEEEPVSSKGFENFLVMDCLHGVQSKGKPSFMGRNYNLGANHILTKAIWPRKVESGDGNCVTKQGFLSPVFDFSSVKTPSGNFSENFMKDSSLPKEPLAVTCPTEVKHLAKPNVNLIKTEPNLCPSRDLQTGESGEVDVSGGARWTGSLGYSSKGVEKTEDSDCWYGSDPACEMPLDLVMYKCIVQEILLQYKYVSNFTIKLLKEGFDLDGHFLALRRYHFMEVADWADYLVGSLFNQRWSHIQAEHNITKVQKLLDSALQRSSCESDPYRERLFVHIKEEDKVSFPGFASGLPIFDCIMLGFRVEWPVTIIITQETLKIYAKIFGYLSQIRFSLFSLTHTWNFLKGIVKANKSPGVMKELNAFLRVRQKISHFVSTLLQYVHSQLSDVSWCRFQHSLKHQVKDMLDMRSKHMSYLQEAVHICFLSDETKPIAAIIRNILQCAIDLSSCFTRMGSNADKLTLHSIIDFPEVSAINMRFESHLNDLHHLYMNLPKHGKLSLSRLWGNLNYNNCYSFASFPF